MSKKHNNECNIPVFTILLIITILFSIAYVTGNIKFFVNLSCCLWVLGLAICLHLEYKTPVKPNGTHLSTPVNKENPEILNNNPSLSPNMSEVVKLTKQVESIKDSFKVINYEVDDYIFVKFEFLKDTVYARINKIDWQNNKNPELVKKYQAVVDSYVGKLNDEYLNIKKQFDDIVDNDVKHEIANVNLID
jgi:hypothetical protein